MQCSYCKGKDFDNSSFGYYVCRSCGKLHYDNKQENKKSGVVGELYFAIGAGAVVLILAILILLFVTASSKRASVHSAAGSTPLLVEKK